jgi:hypothetical protein
VKAFGVALFGVSLALAAIAPPAFPQTQSSQYVASGAASNPSGWNGDWNRPGGNRTRAESNWARVDGTVTAIDGDAVTVREDRGREVSVNMAGVRTRLRTDLKVGDRVSVIGTPTGPDRMTARALREPRVQQDSSDAARDGSSAPSASPGSRR